MPPKLFQRATAPGYAGEAETARERLERLELEYKVKQAKAKRRARTWLITWTKQRSGWPSLNAK